jgi:WD40 repeat protein
VGVEVEPALVAALVADGTDQTGSLPLLQYALTEMFDQRDGARLTLARYASIGGVSGALARRAEDLYARLTPPGQEAVRQLFLRLVTVGEEGNRDTRRRASRAELSGLDVGPEAMDEAINALGARRLLTFDRDPVTRGPTVEVAHEALLGEWARLRDWIDAARDDVRAHRRLIVAANEWVESGRDDSALLRGDRLRRLEAWTQGSGLALTRDERDYLQASVARRDAEGEAEAIRAARERTLERRSLVRLRVVVAVVAALALAALGFTLIVLEQRQEAERLARSATARELAAAAIANLEQDPELSILLAAEAVEVTRPDGVLLREAEEALHRAVRTSRVVHVVPQGGFGLAVSPDGARFATGGLGSDQPARIWDTESGTELVALASSGLGPATHLSFSPDGRVVAAAHLGDESTLDPATKDLRLVLWDARSGARIIPLYGHTGFVTQPVFSPDGRSLAAGGEDGAIRVWDVADGTERVVLAARAGAVYDLAFSPDGSRLASAGSNPEVRVWDLSSGEVDLTLGGHTGEVMSVAFSADGRQVVSGSLDGTARVWDAERGQPLRTVQAPSPVQATAISPDGTQLATAGTDAVARVWDLVTGRELMRLAGHREGVLGNLAYHPDGNRLLTVGLDGTGRVWDVSASGSRDWLTVPGPEGVNAGVTFSPDGSTFAAPSGSAGVTVWDTATGAEVVKLASGGRTITSVAFSPDGSRLVAASAIAGTPIVWDLRSGNLVLDLAGHTGAVAGVVFSRDGSRIVTGGLDGTARIWDATNGKELRALPHLDEVWSVAVSPDGRLIVTGDGEGAVTVWDATSFVTIRTLAGHTNPVVDLAFGRDGVLVSASVDGTAKVWDLASGSERVTLRGHRTQLTQVAVSPDGTRVATTAEDATTRLWDVRTGQEQLTLVGHQGVVSGVDFSPDGRLLATASPDGTTALTLLPIDELTTLARERVTRGLTADECQKYLHVASCPVP